MTKYHYSSTLFTLEICPKTQNWKQIRTQVHTITLNTVTKYKLYPYIQISLNQVFEILSLCKNDKIGGKWLSLHFWKPFLPIKLDPIDEIAKTFH